MIPSPVLEAQALAKKVLTMEKTINERYHKSKQVIWSNDFYQLYQRFKDAYVKAAELYPTYLNHIPECRKPIYRR